MSSKSPNNIYNYEYLYVYNTILMSNNKLNQCSRCFDKFTSKRRLLSHMELQTECHLKNKNFNCTLCQKKFTSKSYLNKHMEKHQSSKKIFPIKLKLKTDSVDSQADPTIVELIGRQMIELIEKQNAEQNQKIVEQNQKLVDLIEKQNIENNQKIAEIIEKRPIGAKNINNINNNLQIICVGSNDNFLDMLTQQWGDFNKALEYIKDCALSSLSGDCKLIESVYIKNQSNSIQYVDKKKTKIQYFDENKNKIIDNKNQLGRKLANNLQNSYLKGVNHLINENLELRGCPNKFLGDYDIQEWNSHIYILSDEKYHKKIISHLQIPVIN